MWKSLSTARTGLRYSPRARTRTFTSRKLRSSSISGNPPHWRLLHALSGRLDASGLFEGANLSSTLRQHTARLLSRIWTAPAFVFAFYRTESLPAFLQQASFGAYGMDDFLLESLPLVGDECLSAIAWGDLTGVPIYTRAGYERIQNVTLSREEARFLSQVAPRPLLRWLVSKDSRKNARNRFFFAS
jgi:hypothetical protein